MLSVLALVATVAGLCHAVPVRFSKENTLGKWEVKSYDLELLATIDFVGANQPSDEEGGTFTIQNTAQQYVCKGNWSIDPPSGALVLTSKAGQCKGSSSDIVQVWRTTEASPMFISNLKVLKHQDFRGVKPSIMLPLPGTASRLDKVW